ncbi:MAG: ribonuclease R [Gammaproteobacteria bacterium]|nr:ribonuclease R [Gammaproteobacteria bacterium]
MRRRARPSSPNNGPRQRDRDREYEHVEDLPSREAILAALEALETPQRLEDLAAHLDVRGPAALNALERRVFAMTRDGQLVQNRAERFGLASRMDLIAGHVLSHRDGFAFVRPDQGGDDIYLAQREARRTLHGDKVLVRVAGFDQRGRPYGNLVEVLERAVTVVVGRYFRDHGIGVVVPDNRHINQDILIPEDASGGARDGQIVVARIEQQPDQRSRPIGRITEVLGEHMAPGMEIEIAIRSYGLPAEWPAAALKDAEAIPDEVQASEIAARRDLRELPLVTIDGADARDFDDAVHARRTAKGFVLHVAIADVSHYVRLGTALDAEAYTRGTSVYFPDRVIPMLPEKLSNGICSLNPGVPRLAMVCELTLAEDGEVRRAQFYPATIRSHARLIYEKVEAWYRGERAQPLADQPEVAANIECLYELYEVLRARREQRGALDIDTIEPRFLYGVNGKIESVEARTRVDAHKLIEECMIAANVAAAKFLLKRRQPGLYRVHEPPAGEKVQALGQFLRELGLSFTLDPDPEPADLGAILVAARERLDKRLIDTMVLRSLKLAVYSAENLGHFGLALEAYTHFTSPIRRYPDLVVHRAIRAALAEEAVSEDARQSMVEIASQTSMAERRADEATRDAVAWLKCEFMQDKVGECFGGIVSGVAEFGVFVELDDIFVEGLVHVTALPDDYYQYDAVRHALRGRAGGRQFSIGQAVEVQVTRVDLDERKIDFRLVEQSRSRPRRKGRRR